MERSTLKQPMSEKDKLLAIDKLIERAEGARFDDGFVDMAIDDIRMILDAPVAHPEMS
jgi:hypothetical protein